MNRKYLRVHRHPRGHLIAPNLQENFSSYPPPTSLSPSLDRCHFSPTSEFYFDLRDNGTKAAETDEKRIMGTVRVDRDCSGTSEPEVDQDRVF